MTRDGDMSGGHPKGADSRTWKPESLCDPLIEIGTMIWPTAFVQRREPAGQETPNGTGIEYHTG